jgi:UDP-2,3-diacylglucosamine pyrophosphatase LpxH
MLGDIGIGFRLDDYEKEKIAELNDFASKRNINIYCVRGNHDDPRFFTGEYDMENIKLVPDYSVINVNGYNVLCIGGGLSIDRTRRKSYINPAMYPSVDYWPDELNVFNKKAIDDIKVDINIVASHTAPSFCFPNSKDSIIVALFIGMDTNLSDDMKKERVTMTETYEYLKSKNHSLNFWFYGHFHMNISSKYDDTKFTCVDINTIIEPDEIFNQNNNINNK